MIECIVDDLAFVKADAVLRPADALLEPITAAAIALDRQAGASFAEQRRLGAPLEAGAAVITPAGELAADFVLHVVLQDREQEASRETVRRALRSAWQRASEWGLSHVAAAPLGAGPGLLDVDDAAALMAETLAEHSSPLKLTLVVEREREREMIQAVLRRFIA